MTNCNNNMKGGFDVSKMKAKTLKKKRSGRFRSNQYSRSANSGLRDTVRRKKKRRYKHGRSRSRSKK